MTKARREPKRVSFEDALAEVEKIVDELERGDIGLDDAIAAYEKGVKAMKRCQAILAKAEKRIEVLSGQDAEGNPAPRPFKEEDRPADDESDDASGAPDEDDDGESDQPALF